jgi:2-methylisocitrate lyase-like PEP mutase family enzyme
MQTHAQKAEAFRALHRGDRAFIIPNPWDVGTARLLESMKFEALATTSAGYAYTLGKPDGAVDRDAMLAHAAIMADATGLPVSADLENGYADAPEAVAETVRRAGAVGLAGCSIEDVPLGRESGPYDIAFAAERIRAAAEAAHGLPVPIVLTARAENFIVGRPDLRDTIARLQAFEQAGADVLFAPGITSERDIADVIASIDLPLNVIMGLQGASLTLDRLSQLGVKRVSVGSALSRAALGAFLRAARELRDFGTSTFAAEAVKYAEINAMFA